MLREDDHPALYLYDQSFTVEGKTHTRKGFLARVRLEPFGEGKIFPHEQTLAGPKADRLALYKATSYNLSPIFGLYPDANGEVFAPSRQACATGRHWKQPTTSASKPALAGDRPQDPHPGAGPDGPEADLHRRRPPPLRDRPEVSATSSQPPARWPARTTRPTSA